MITRLQGPALATLARAVAPHLPGDWHTVTMRDGWTCYVEVSEADGRTLSFSSAYNDSMLHISGNFPEALRKALPSYNGALPSAKVSPERPPEAIAKDIARRILPTYTIKYIAALETARAYAADCAAQDALVERMSRAFGAKLRESRDQHYRHDAAMYLFGGHGECRVSGDRVTLDLRVSPEEAEAVAALLIGMRAED